MGRSPVLLLAEVLYEGMGCPVCGGEKTSRARTCRLCYETLGPEATKAVDAVAETCAKAAEGHKAALSAPNAVTRGVVWGPILAQVKIDKDAQLHKAQNGIAAYWDCSKSVPGGFISLYVFGAAEDQRGKTVNALVELKTKEHRPGETVHYLRAQAVEGVKSDAILALSAIDQWQRMVIGLPIARVTEKNRKFSIGFRVIAPC